MFTAINSGLLLANLNCTSMLQDRRPNGSVLLNRVVAVEIQSSMLVLDSITLLSDGVWAHIRDTIEEPVDRTDELFLRPRLVF